MYTGIKAIEIKTDSLGIHYTWESIDAEEVEKIMKNWKKGVIYEN